MLGNNQNLSTSANTTAKPLAEGASHHAPTVLAWSEISEILSELRVDPQILLSVDIPISIKRYQIEIDKKPLKQLIDNLTQALADTCHGVSKLEISCGIKNNILQIEFLLTRNQPSKGLIDFDSMQNLCENLNSHNIDIAFDDRSEGKFVFSEKGVRREGSSQISVVLNIPSTKN